MLENKDRKERGSDRGNKIDLVNKSFERKNPVN